MTKNYVGIDLGTSNSVIATFDGVATQILKSPSQHEVTPSAIYLDKRSKYVGEQAYNLAPRAPKNSATLFKRFMGTSTPHVFEAAGVTKSAVECSAEILKTLYGYLPEEIRNNPDTGTVITVPAAFNQMQKDATQEAATLAGIGKIVMIQEPVAAVMGVARATPSDGVFLVFDLGGGTLDIAIAQNLKGHVNLLAHGGIQVCGGRDFDRKLYDQIVRPWIKGNFKLDDDFDLDPDYSTFKRLAIWATEKAKIELSSLEETVVTLSEMEARVHDLSGNDLYLAVPLSRKECDSVILSQVDQAIDDARTTLRTAGLNAHDLERIVFVGGPTKYKPLRDKISFELGAPASTEVDPMTVVAQGASIFAESIDWESVDRARKPARGQINIGGQLSISFDYVARTPNNRARVAASVLGYLAPNYEFQVDSLDTGWTSGRYPLRNGETIELSLPKHGENHYKIFVFDSVGGPLSLENERITIVRTAALVNAIPASHSIGIEVLDRVGGKSTLDYIVRTGDSLPLKGNLAFKSKESLKSGSSASINFKLWEGEIESPVTDNRFVGLLKVTGTDFHDGVIPAGAHLECEYSISDSGLIRLEVSVPCIGSSFPSSKNFYSRQEGQSDLTTSSDLVRLEVQETLARVNELGELLVDPRLDKVHTNLTAAIHLDGSSTEATQESQEVVLTAKKIMAEVKKDHSKVILNHSLIAVRGLFEEHVKEHARPTEITAFQNLVRAIERAIKRNEKNAETLIDELRSKNFEILWRQDWFVVARFKSMVEHPDRFSDPILFNELSQAGHEFIRIDDIERLKSIVGQLYSIEVESVTVDGDDLAANILRG